VTLERKTDDDQTRPESNGSFSFVPEWQEQKVFVRNTSAGKKACVREKEGGAV